MTKFDNKLKTDIKLISIMFLAFLILAGLNFFFRYQTNALNKLIDADININQLVINEIMTNNRGAHANEYGNVYGWIEFYNGTNRDINLNEYALSDRDNGATRWKFPDVVIESNGYLIVYLARDTRPGLYASFGLRSSGGELLTLKHPSGSVVDQVRTVALERNHVMARNSNGDWIVTDEITPGYSNNVEGRNNYLASLHKDSTDLIINEILPANRGNFHINGAFPGYIEVKNTGDNPINLQEYFLSNNSSAPFLWSFPDKVLNPGEIHVVFDNRLDAEDTTSFNLRNRNGTVILSHKNKIVDEISYTNLSPGYALIRINDEFIESTNLSPGYANTSAGIRRFLETHNRNPNDLMIREVMNSNSRFFPHNGGVVYNFIVLQNNSNRTINLSDYTITTDMASKNMFTLPDRNLRSGEFYILMTSGNPDLSTREFTHANFRLGSTESLFLYRDGNLVDSMFISDIPVGYTYGRNNRNGFYYFSNPSPGTANSSGARIGISSRPTFITESGIYNNINYLSVELRGAGTIYYTLDGSEPTRNSRVYTVPIVLDETTVIRAVNYDGGVRISQTVTSSFIINENHTLPVMSVSLPPASFNSMRANVWGRGRFRAHAEFFDGDSGFAIDCGFRLHGGQSRTQSKTSFSLEFGREFGPANLHYRVFENRDAVRFSTLNLRGGSQDYLGSMMRDELGTGILDRYGTVTVQAYRPIILYINGNYWGIYYIRENTSPEMLRHRHNVNANRNNTNIFRINGDENVGSRATYAELLNFVENNNMRLPENFEHVKTKLNIDNFLDHWIAAIYVFHLDIINVRYYSHPDIDDGRWRMIFFDLDHAFHTNGNYFTFMTREGGISSFHNLENVLIRGLMVNSEFRTRFIERLAFNLNEVWSDENVLGKFDELYNLLEPEMERNMVRWGASMDTWRREARSLRNFLENRRETVIRDARNFFNLTEEEMRLFGR